MKKFSKYAVMVLAIILALTVLTGCGSKNEINLQNYVTVEVNGGNGYGKAYASIDYLGLDALSGIRYTLDKTENLSNGDKITVSVTYPEALGEVLDANIIPASGDSWSVEVAGLIELYTFDLFENIEISFDGYNGFGVPDVQVNGGNNVGWSASQEEYLSNGDVVTVTLTGPDGGDLLDYCMFEGFLPEKKSMEFTVSGLAELPKVDLFENLDVTVEGKAPFLKLAIRSEHDDIEYEVVNTGRLEGGDEVTIQACVTGWDLEEYCFEEMRKAPATDTYTYTIPETQEYYLLDQEQLTEEIMEQAIHDAEELFDSASKSVEIKDVEYYGYYLQTAKDDEREVGHCCLYIIHEVKYRFEGANYTAYHVVSFEDAFVDVNRIFRCANADNLYGWYWESGVEDLYDFQEAYITVNNADYHSVSGK